MNLERFNKPERTLYISNLPYDATEKELESIIGNIVPIEEVYIFYKSYGTSTGTGEILVRNRNDAAILCDRIKNTLFKGRIIRVQAGLNGKNMYQFSTYLVDNLPLDVTSRELKKHFRHPFTVKKASVFYNEDGSSTGRGIVKFLGHFREIDDIYYYDQCKIKGKKMEFRDLYIFSYTGVIPLMENNQYLQLYIVNLHYDVKAEDLEAYFGRWFEVAEAIIYYEEDGTSTGTGAITFYEFESIPKIFRFVVKAFEDRYWSVMCPCDPENYYSFKDVESSFNIIEDEIEEYADFHEKVQNPFQSTQARKQLKKYSDSDVKERLSIVDEIILLKQFNKGGSKERLLKLRYYNSFANQHFRQRSYFVALRLGIPECEFHCAIYVTNLHYDVTEEELRAFFSAEVPVKRTFLIANRVGTSSGTGMVVFKSRRDRLLCLLLFENKKLRNRILDMKCVPGLTKKCW